MLGQVLWRGYKNNQKSVARWVEYSQNATLVFISAYSAYVFCGKITIPLSTRLYQQRYLFWQGQKDSNPRHAVLETAALPTELYPYIQERAIRQADLDRSLFFMVGHQGLEPRTDRL